MLKNSKKNEVIQYQMISLNVETYNKLLELQKALEKSYIIKNPEPVAPLLEKIAEADFEQLKALLMSAN